MSFPPPTSGLARLIWLALGALAVAILVTVCAGIVWGLGNVLRLLSPVLWPLAIAGVIAYLLDPLVDLLERRRVPRQRAIWLVFCTGLLVVGSFLGSIVPRVIHETSDLIAAVPAYSRQIQTNL